MGVAILTFAVPVRAAADPEPEPLGEANESLLDGRGMARVAHVETVQCLILKSPELSFGPMIAQVRRDGQPTHLVHQRGDFGEGWERFLDVRRPAPAEVAAKRIRDVFTRPAAAECARDMRPTHRAAAAADELRLHVLQLDRHTESLQLAHDLSAPPPPPRARI